MRRMSLALALALVFALSGLAAAQAGSLHSAKTKVTLCHKTASKKHPYVKITVSTRAELRSHQNHPADIIPAPAGGCPKAALSPTQGGTELKATLSGANEVPPADPDGTGTASFRLQAGQGQVCFTLMVANITLPATAAHIHVGAAGVNGPIVIPLTPPDASGKSSGCTTASRTLVGQILANPAGFYANVHTTDFPGGAIRGQLS